MSEVEDRVRALNKLRAKAEAIEDGMRSMRLGGKPELRFKRMWWRGMVIADGWLRQEAEPLPAGIEAEFYDFLSGKAKAVAAIIQAEEKSLDALTPSAEATHE